MAKSNTLYRIVLDGKVVYDWRNGKVTSTGRGDAWSKEKTVQARLEDLKEKFPEFENAEIQTIDREEYMSALTRPGSAGAGRLTSIERGVYEAEQKGFTFALYKGADKPFKATFQRTRDGEREVIVGTGPKERIAVEEAVSQLPA